MHEALEVVQEVVLEGVEANREVRFRPRRANARAEAVVACGGASRWGALHTSFVGAGGGVDYGRRGHVRREHGVQLDGCQMTRRPLLTIDGI